MEYKELKKELAGQIEYAPFGEPPAKGLIGWWIPATHNGDDGLAYLCSKCSSRIVARGFSLPKGSEALFGEGPHGVCITCGA